MMGKLLSKLMSVDTVDAFAGLAYVGAGAVTLLPNTSITFIGESLFEYALIVSLIAVAIAYTTNKPDLSFDSVEEKVYTSFAGLSVLIPVAFEYIDTISSEIATNTEYGYILFAVSFLAYFIVAGLHSPSN